MRAKKRQIYRAGCTLGTQLVARDSSCVIIHVSVVRRPALLSRVEKGGPLGMKATTVSIAHSY